MSHYTYIEFRKINNLTLLNCESRVSKPLLRVVGNYIYLDLGLIATTQHYSLALEYIIE